MPKIHASDQQLSEELRRLFEFVPPQDLRKALEYFYFSYTSEGKNLQALPEHFQHMSADIYRLIDFLDKISTLEKKNKIGLIQEMVERFVRK